MCRLVTQYSMYKRFRDKQTFIQQWSCKAVDVTTLILQFLFPKLTIFQHYYIWMDFGRKKNFDRIRNNRSMIRNIVRNMLMLWDINTESRKRAKWLACSRPVPYPVLTDQFQYIKIRGGSRIFLRRGCTSKEWRHWRWGKKIKSEYVDT